MGNWVDELDLPYSLVDRPNKEAVRRADTTDEPTAVKRTRESNQTLRTTVTLAVQFGS